jgi:FkbM family methyltransferase
VNQQGVGVHRFRMIDPGGADQVANAVARDWRSFECPLPEVLVLLCADSKGAFYDVGANTGFYSVLIGRSRLAPTIRAFEPVPHIAAAARRNLALNRVDVEVVEAALGMREGTATLYIPPGDHNLIETSASLLPDFKESIAGSFDVPLRTLDSVNAEHGREAVSVIKIDVEGAEDQVLRGAERVLDEHRPCVSVELLHGADWDYFNGLLALRDYAVVPLLARGELIATDSVSFNPDAHNQLLVPAENVDDVLASLRSRRTSATVIDPLRDEDPALAALIECEADRLSYLAWVEVGTSMRVELADRRKSPGPAAADLIRQVQELRHQVGLLEASRSWRVTAPLRWIGERAHRRH